MDHPCRSIEFDNMLEKSEADATVSQTFRSNEGLIGPTSSVYNSLDDEEANLFIRNISQFRY